MSFKLPNNGFVFIIGKSGSGKSTLLNLIGGLDNITDGQIIFNNEEIIQEVIQNETPKGKFKFKNKIK